VRQLLVLAALVVTVNPAWAQCERANPGTTPNQVTNLISALNCVSDQPGDALLVDKFAVAANSGVRRQYPAVAVAVLSESVGDNVKTAVATPNPKGATVSVVHCSLEVRDQTVLGTCLDSPGMVYVVYRK
jgi:hypothetical protein